MLMDERIWEHLVLSLSLFMVGERGEQAGGKGAGRYAP